MGIVRLEALRGLSAAIAEEIPELAEHICVGQADASHDLCFPSLAIIPVGRWTFEPFQADEHHEPAPDRVVMCVGYHESNIQLRLGAATAFKRYELEQKMIDLFLKTPLKPGVLLTTIVACEELGDFVAAWHYDEDEWVDEAAFDQKYYSVIGLTAILPALVTREAAYTIDQLQLGLTHDFNTTLTPTTFNTSELVEVVQVNQDGSISPA